MKNIRVKYLFSLILLMFISVMLVACGSEVYTITYKVDSRVYGVIDKYEEGDKITLPANPTKEGYKFVKWSIDIPDTMPAKDLIAHARFVPNRYTITFDYNGATTVGVATLNVTYDSAIGTLPIPSKTGHTFDGWYLDGGRFDETTVYKRASNITLTAKFTPTKVGVYFYKDTAMTDLHQFVEVSYGQGVASIPSVPNKDGYDGAWSVSSFDNITSVTKVYPVYTAKTYTITFDYAGATGGNSDVSKEVTFDSIVGTLPAPTKPSMYFVGWYIDDELIADDMLYRYARDLVAVARFSTSRHTVRFYTDDTMSTLFATRYLSAGQTSLTNIPTSPVVLGTTSEWVGDFSNITSDMSVYATYTYIDYTVTYMIGSTVYKTDTYHYGDTIILPTVLDTDKYIFVKWDTTLTTMPLEDVVIYADVVYFTLDISTYESTDTITITKGGTYTISGHSDGAHIVVNASEKVTLNLNGVTYVGDDRFINVLNDTAVDIILMSGQVNTIDVLVDTYGIYVKGALKIGGPGALNITTKDTSIYAGSISVDNGDIHISASAIAVVCDTITVTGGEVYINTTAYEGVDRFVEDPDGKYVYMYGGYILDEGNYSSEIHYSRIMTYGMSVRAFVLDGGHISMETLDTSIVATEFRADTGVLDIVSLDGGIVADTMSLFTDININSVSNIGIECKTIVCTGADVYISSGDIGIQSTDNAMFTSTALTIESRGDGIYGKVVALEDCSCSITTVGTYVRNDDGIYKYNGGKYSRYLKSDYGKYSQRYNVAQSVKGIYAVDMLKVYSGTYVFDTVESALYSEDLLYVLGGSVSIVSQCEAIYSRALLQVGYKDAATLSDGFNVVVSESYVGFMAGMLEIYDGNIMIHSHTDGMYVLASSNVDISHYLNISGVGVVAISAEEDGLDVNGSILIDGGHTYIYSGNVLDTYTIKYTADYYYMAGEVLLVGHSMYTPTLYSDTVHFVGYSLDSTQYRRCTKNTYLMLYDDITGLEDAESTLNIVIHLGIRNYISGMTIMYGSESMVKEHKYALRYGSSSYEGGTVPSILPYICTGGAYKETLGSSIAGIVMADGVQGVLYGQFAGVANPIGSVGQYTTLTTLDTVVVEFDKHIDGGFMKNPPVAPPVEE